MLYGVTSDRSMLRRAPHLEVAFKLRVSHLVGGADLEPDGLPPAAILIVRRLADPLPRGLSAGQFPLAAAPAWERATRLTLGEIARAAVRPAREAVPTNANAVLFADQAELLTCFSRDYLRGEAASLWWWRTTLRVLSGTGSRALFELWRQNIHYVPALVAKLAELKDAAWVLRSFTSEQARTILQEAARAFDLRDVLAIVENSRSPRERDTALQSSLVESSTIRNGASPRRSRYSVATPPWRDVDTVVALSAGLGREHVALAGVLLELSQSPRTVRSRIFAVDLERWWRPAPGVLVHESETTERRQEEATFDESDGSWNRDKQNVTRVDIEDAAAGNSPSEPRLTERRLNGKHSLADAQLTTGRTESPSDGEDLPSKFIAVSHVRLLSEERAFSPSLSRMNPLHGPQVQSNDSKVPEFIAQLQGYLQPSEQASLVAPSLQVQQRVSDTKGTLDTGDCVITELGGVFFLVNLMKALGIPQELERECQSELCLGSWECLELIARCLLGANRPELANDAAWRVLSILDCRPPEQGPGAHFRPASFYRLPEAWPLKEGISTTTAALRVRRNRVELWNPLGFPQTVWRIDERLSARDVTQLTLGCTLTSFKKVPQLFSEVEVPGVSLARPLLDFLAFLMPFVRWRLAASLGLNSKRRPDLIESLLLRTGKVWMTATHVDVAIPLKQANSAVRFAGLDADPGWVPDFGRIIKFHFQ